MALALGILVAALSFTLLTSAASTSKLVVGRTVKENFRPAYDILVRPQASFTLLERKRALVRENYLNGIFGGITMNQYRLIKTVPGVETAAPIANIGFIFPFEFLPIRINRFLTREQFQLYRLRLRWLAHNRSSVYPDDDEYVYFTRRDPLLKGANAVGQEKLPSGGLLPVCSGFIEAKIKRGLSSDPFDRRSTSGLTCFSERTPRYSYPTTDYGQPPAGFVGTVSTVYFPIFIAAIDPEAEQELVGFDRTVVQGRNLNRGDRIESLRRPFSGDVAPVIASTRTYLDEVLQVEVQSLRVPRDVDLPRRLASSRNTDRWLFARPGRQVGLLSLEVKRFYEKLIDRYSLDPSEWRSGGVSYQGYWTTSPTRYKALGEDVLRPLPVHNPVAVFTNEYYGGGWAPQENRDVHFRRLHFHAGNPNRSLALHVVGRFDPERLPGFSELSRVPLETYYPPQVKAGDAAARRALGGRPLLPTMNLADYVAQPPLMLTTLEGLKGFLNPNLFDHSGVRPKDPISVIRVRVAGVKGPDPASRERIKAVATTIHRRTGLAVDITAGSSPHLVTIELPPGKFGRPALTLREGWVQKGVAVRFLEAIDKKSAALFGLVLVICSFFLANAAFAGVKARRSEIGTLMCLGWRRSKVFGAIVGELALVGACAGMVGNVIAALLVAAFNLQLSVVRTLLVLPLSVILAVIAGVLPAARAARGRPLDALTPAVAGTERARSIAGVLSLAVSNLVRTPARTVLGAAGLLLGIGALTVLVALNQAFQGTLVGNLLGRYISVEVRGVDFLSVVLVIALGGLSVADVLYMNLKERAAELVTLRTLGWRERELRRLVAAEGLGIGLLGSIVGVALGVGASALVRGVALSTIATGAAVAGAVGVMVALAASVAPLPLLRRLSAPVVLAEEW